MRHKMQAEVIYQHPFNLYLRFCGLSELDHHHVGKY